MNVFEQIKQKEVSKKRIGRISFMEFLEVLDEVEKEQNNGWIPCSERLPEEYGDYLVWWADITGKQYYEIAEYEPNNGWIGEIPQAVEGKYSVIAWQPLPEPYKEGEEE